MNNSMMQTVMNMKADLYKQQNAQSSSSGRIKREWVYDTTIQCKVEPVKSGGASNRADNKRFDIGPHNEYDEKLQLKMKVLVPVSKRWRIYNIKSSDNKSVYTEMDRIDNPDTIFDVTASHAVLDPFGRIAYYEITLQRVHIQDDSTESE